MGRKKLFCCWGDPHNPNNGKTENEINELRNKLLAGEKIDHCSRCYKLESEKLISPRLRESVRWMKDPDVKKYIDTLVPDTDPFIYFYDLRHDNKCNLACISCSPRDSSMWQKEMKLVDITSISADSDINFDFNNLKFAKKIYCAGGEPLLIDLYIKIIDYIVEHDMDIEVIINTNMTVASGHILDKLVKLKNCCLVVSVDSFGSVNEYHRYPMSWDKFMNNLNEAKKFGLKIIFNTVVDAVSVFGFDNFFELDDYPMEWNLQLVNNAPQLDLPNIPLAHKQRAIESVNGLKKSKFYSTSIEFNKKVNHIIDEINKTGDPQSLINFIDTIDNRRQISHQDYIGINFSKE